MNLISDILTIGSWTVRQKDAEGSGPHKLLLMLHGWTGDENSMWIFPPRLPKNYLIISPRGIYKTPSGGYGWREDISNGWPLMNDFQPAIDALLDLLKQEYFPKVNVDKFDLIGYSQGASLGYSITLMYPKLVGRLAGLSGFLPLDAQEWVTKEPLRGRRVFIAHGRLDELVPIEKAREVVQVLKQAGGEVLYCEEDVGHKLSAGYFRGMDKYFARDS
jgi:phospholipase/carboxylesterase